MSFDAALTGVYSLFIDPSVRNTSGIFSRSLEIFSIFFFFFSIIFCCLLNLLKDSDFFLNRRRESRKETKTNHL